MSGNRMNSMRRNTELRTRDEMDLAQELSVPEQEQSDPAQSGPVEVEKEKGHSIQDPAAQRIREGIPWQSVIRKNAGSENI